MRTTIRLLLLLTGGVWSRAALAQTPTLEFASGAGNPTGNGPTIGAQVITFQNNTNNPIANTFAAFTPVTTATLALSNQLYTSGLVFGGAANLSGSTPTGSALFPAINSVDNSNNNYTSANGIAGGIDVNANSGVELYTDVSYLGNNATPNTRYQYADLTITFNQPMVNPVVHVTGLGNNNGNSGNYTTELDLLTDGVMLSKLSGSNELYVQSNKILNTAADPTADTGLGVASGSVLVTTSGAGITSLQFRVYLRTGNTVTALTPSGSSGDGWLLAISNQTPPPVVTGYVYEDVNYGGGAGRPLTASSTAVRSGARLSFIPVQVTLWLPPPRMPKASTLSLLCPAPTRCVW
jgi:hypothetical protein